MPGANVPFTITKTADTGTYHRSVSPAALRVVVPTVTITKGERP